ncbi:MAG: class B sortase [Ruminococcaceae bacterium]|jgi:sortase B|nr:class B sortase [Oscillospiraceae bacterium]
MTHDFRDAQGNIHVTPEQAEAYYEDRKRLKKKAKNITLNALLVVLGLVIVVTGVYTAITFADIQKSKKEALALAELTTFDVNDGAFNKNFDGVTFPAGILEEYKAAYAANDHLVGWIKVPETTIDFPVVQCENNSAYLTYDFYRNYNERGSIYLDCRNDIAGDDTSLILYGHNFYDGTMFSPLENYEELDFYKKAPVIEFDTILQKKKWKVFSVFITTATAGEDNGYLFNYIYPYLQGENYSAFLSELKKRSLINTTVDANTSDQLLILSTCTKMLDISSSRRADGRCVIVARAVRPGESEKVDVAAATVNENAKLPQIWYTKNKLENPFANDDRWEPIATR